MDTYTLLFKNKYFPTKHRSLFKKNKFKKHLCLLQFVNSEKLHKLVNFITKLFNNTIF